MTPAGSRELVRVVLPLPLRRTFLYGVPRGKPSPAPGTPVVVPVGPRKVCGVVVDSPASRTAEEADVEVRELLDLDEKSASLDGELLVLTRFVADYWLCGWGEAVRAALPPAVRPAPAPAAYRRVAAFADATPAERATAQRAVWALLPDDGSAVPESDIPAPRRPALRSLIERGWVERVDASATMERPAEEHVLTPGQADALAAVRADVESGEFGVRLLRGVTGSGKTEVYLRAAAAVLAAGRGVLFLVPEIALTPMLVDRVRRRFGSSVEWMHSGRSAGERRRAWERAARGESRFVVGTRSAVFAPIRDLGLIVVDEEHDASYKQEETPRYHGRDLAIVRAQRAGARVLLGSATPALESYRHALEGRYALSELTSRVHDRPLPEVEFVDMRDAYRAAGEPVDLSEPLLAAVGETVARGEQALILRNRRGWAPLALCASCGERLECGQCAASLTWHRRDARLRCHLCGFECALPSRCPACREDALQLQGTGTERVEDRLRDALGPDVRVERLDRDVTRRKDAAERLLSRFAAREIDVLVGTQMIAKGHDFPNVTTVGVLQADQSLGLPDFRAGERTFQLLTQVAGRAGRGAAPGRVWVQAYDPDHAVLRHAARQDYPAFYAYEIEYRRALGYPPFKGLALLRVRDEDRERARSWAGRLAEGYRALEEEELTVTGPLEPVPERVRNRWRFDVLLRHPSRRRLVEWIEAGWPSGPGAVPARAIRVDVDPQSLT